MPIEPGATYVVDLGYQDYAWWAKRDAAGCRIVPRLKKNAPLTIVEERVVPEGGNVLTDRVGYLAFARLVRTNLMHRRHLRDLQEPDTPSRKT